jgi:hypothetical protein
MPLAPERDEAAPYYSTYIDRVRMSSDIVATLDGQLPEVVSFLSGVTEEKSRHRYAPEKWSMRQVLSHMSDTERVFLFRAFWFARGFETPLASFDQNVAALSSGADERSWASLVAEFQDVRRATLSFLRSLPAENWMRRGVASDNPVTVRALAYICAGHVAHHEAVLKERYL